MQYVIQIAIHAFFVVLFQCIKSEKFTQWEHKFTEFNLSDGLVGFSQKLHVMHRGYNTERNKHGTTVSNLSSSIIYDLGYRRYSN